MLAWAIAKCKPGRRGDRTLDHRSDLTDDPGRLGDRVHPDRVDQSAGLHQLDVDQVRRPQLDHPPHLAHAVDALIGHDRRAGRAADFGQGGDIVLIDRLLDVVRVAGEDRPDRRDRDARAFSSPG